MQDTSDNGISDYESTISCKFSFWHRILTIFVTDFTNIVDVITSANTSSLDKLAFSIWALLFAIDFGSWRNAIANIINVLPRWANFLDFGLAV